ncbi:MAG: four helix bundle protein [Parcubacteria group bacterium]
MKISRFEDLDIWKISVELTRKIYSFTGAKEFSKDFALRDQIRRSVLSIGANIAEGFERNNNNEFIRYLSIAKGSTGETRSHLYVAKILKYVSDKEYSSVNNEL